VSRAAYWLAEDRGYFLVFFFGGFQVAVLLEGKTLPGLVPVPPPLYLTGGAGFGAKVFLGPRVPRERSICVLLLAIGSLLLRVAIGRIRLAW
jgi:hypothetical protein